MTCPSCHSFNCPFLLWSQRDKAPIWWKFYGPALVSSAASDSAAIGANMTRACMIPGHVATALRAQHPDIDSKIAPWVMPHAEVAP